MGFLSLTPGVVKAAVEASQFGPVVYAHQEYHGGTGFDAAVVWHRGDVIFGPLFTANHEAERQGDAYIVVGHSSSSAINEALRATGVERGGHRDEFQAVGLERHRWTDEWASPPTR